jgi:hypothetical protein
LAFRSVGNVAGEAGARPARRNPSINVTGRPLARAAARLLQTLASDDE